MSDVQKPFEMIDDFATGRRIPDIGAEANRQALERHLVEEKGYAKEEIEIDIPITATVAGAPYRSKVDLAVRVGGRRVMVAKCAAGALGSREREVLAAARLLDDHQIPRAVASDGADAIVLDTPTGKRVGTGLSAVPDREAAAALAEAEPIPFPEARREREQIIFRSFDLENVNRHIDP